MKYGKKKVFRHKKRSHKRRTSRRSTKSSNNNVVIKMPLREPPVVVADIYRLKMRFTKFYSVAGSGTIFDTFRGNDIYDPYVGTNNSVNGLTQLSNLYNKFRVYGSRITVKAVNTTPAQSIYMLVYPDNDAAVSVNIDKISAMPFAKTKLIGPVSGTDKSIVSQYISTAKLWGVSKSAVSDDITYSGKTRGNTPSTNVVSGWFWYLFFITADGASVMDVQYEAQIDYWVELYDRAQITPYELLAEETGPQGGTAGPQGPQFNWLYP